VGYIKFNIPRLEVIKIFIVTVFRNITLFFDVVNPEQPLAENWGILETYLGAEVFLERLEN